MKENFKVVRWRGRGKPTLKFLKKELENEGSGCFTFVCYPGDIFGDHTHDADEVRVGVEGRMKYGIGDKEFILGPGDRIDIKKRVVHRAEVVGNEKVLCLGLSKY